MIRTTRKAREIRKGILEGRYWFNYLLQKGWPPYNGTEFSTANWWRWTFTRTWIRTIKRENEKEQIRHDKYMADMRNYRSELEKRIANVERSERDG